MYLFSVSFSINMGIYLYFSPLFPWEPKQFIMPVQKCLKVLDNYI